MIGKTVCVQVIIDGNMAIIIVSMLQCMSNVRITIIGCSWILLDFTRMYVQCRSNAVYIGAISIIFDNCAIVVMKTNAVVTQQGVTYGESPATTFCVFLIFLRENVTLSSYKFHADTYTVQHIFDVLLRF